ncbi:hypothetical protein MyChFU_49050 [Mycobacterium intracellulare subsp. chimaera]
MFDFTETILIHAPREKVWNVVRDIEQWWLRSNPDHDALEHLDQRPATEVGAKLRIREKIGGIPGEAVGVITAAEPGTAVTWEAEANYRWLGVSVRVNEGVTWRLEPISETSTRLSARVWATSPSGIFGRFASLVFTRLLNGEVKDRAHARTELQYLKRTIEGHAVS